MFGKKGKRSVVVALLLVVLAVIMTQGVTAQTVTATEETALAAEGLAWRLRTEVVEGSVLAQSVSTDKYWWAGEAALKSNDWAKAQSSFEAVSAVLLREAVKESYQGPSVPKCFFDFASEVVVLQELSLADLKVRVQQASNPPQEVVLYDGPDSSLVAAYIDPGFLIKYPELIIQYNLWENAQQVTIFCQSSIIWFRIKDTQGGTPSLDLFDTNWSLSKWQFLGEIGPNSVKEVVFSGENYDW